MALTARELEENERARQNKWHQQNMEARDRFNESKGKAAISDPGRFSPWERQAVEEERKTIALRKREMDMADKKYASDLAMQQEKTRSAGEAARQTGLTNIELSKLQDGYTDESGTFIPGSKMQLEQERIRAGLTQAEDEMDAKRDIASIEAGVRNNESKRRYGFFDKDGTYVGGSDYNAADVAGRHKATAMEHELEQKRLDERSRAEANAAAKQAANAREDARNLEIDRGRALTNILEGKDNAMPKWEWAKLKPEQQRAYLDGVVCLTRAPAAGAAGTGQGAAQPNGGGAAGAIPNVPGYSPKRVADIMAKGYRWDGRKWVK